MTSTDLAEPEPEMCEVCGQHPHETSIWAYSQESGEHRLFVCGGCEQKLLGGK